MISKEEIDIFDYISFDTYNQIVDDCIQNNQDISQVEEKIRTKIYDKLVFDAKKSAEKTKSEKIKSSRTIKFTDATYNKEITATVKVAPIIVDNIDYDKNCSVENFLRYEKQLLSANQYAKYIQKTELPLSYGKLRDILFFLKEKNPKDNIVTILSFIYIYFEFNIKIFIDDYLPASIINLCKEYMRKYTSIIPEDSSNKGMLTLF